MKIPKITSQITVLCDCTELGLLKMPSEVLNPEYGMTPDPRISIHCNDCSPISAQKWTYQLLSELQAIADNNPDWKGILVLRSSQEVFALCSVLANSTVEHPIANVPIIDAKSIKVYEVWDEENILISVDGRVPESSYDKAFQPIVADFTRIQSEQFKHTPPDEEEGDVVQFVDTEGGNEGEPKIGVEELIEQRKQRVVKDSKEVQNNETCTE